MSRNYNTIFTSPQVPVYFYDLKVGTSGVFKIGDLDNANIIVENGEYVIYDFTSYFPGGSQPTGWSLPDAWNPKKY